MSAPLLSVSDLKVHFDVGRKRLFGGGTPAVVKAVDGVSFDLKPGETLGLVGESGCGKSTLGRAVLRLLPLKGGRTVWLGQDLAKLDADAMRGLRREMQIIFQDPLASLNPRMTVGQIIAEPLTTFQPNLSANDVKARVKAMMAKVGLLPNQVNRYPHEFSGGQCQRIGIARAIINNPRLIVCDEPVSALDVSIQAQIVNLLMDLQKEMGMSLIFISHNLAIVRHISHRVMVLYLGKVMEIADRDSLYKNPLHPYTQALNSAVPVPDPEIEQSKARIVLKGDLPSPLNPPSGCPFRTRCPRATEICAQEMPELVSTGKDHMVACHHAGPPHLN
ncbi:MAG: dipeptide ABC transporter ATP-binding protein [Proteobacteria bacterium]|nr:dipeptide ABC transporter ATP-binding protein [Pseudomonadota bacterium]